ncbi:GNAT family N-acetyltransferase [Streptomyces agglomeratus]|uniref:GNAT family N-acetyltransferase n=1 Tax=Streptomyces agglomeratus TaxID=285458 RepID=A0A1E5PDL9_9ACTN|nr:GNAT family N-acetyltransferase [Streptomyces agglomeratus]OEJ27623.1 GNAT family N-acetyltransferase [Streptomyces agglomeratus]OEJ38317.1 GNAT family N-acetyltransferase [Streptomyces agglomeratus]OEJ47299.1 GNAT family N-acetyltransferase [Streptomyces agglomeratus]OEJ58208.1 GNAT family N-acetyltransferase [Streptomyces agglomeratus]
MTLIVRDFTPADTDAWVRVRRAALPFMVTTPESVAFERATAHPDKKMRMLVAEEDGELIGTAFAGIAYDSTEPGQAFVTPQIHPGHRTRGAGSLLLRAAEEHLRAEGATAVYAWVVDTPESRAFAEHRGYRPTRPMHFQRLDLANGRLPPRQPLPAGVELHTAADFRDDPRPVFEADAETTADEPSDISTDFTDYEDWISHTWNHPLLDHGLSTVVVADGRVAAFTAAQTDGLTRYWSGMTGTVRAHRGRGFAKLAKNDSLHLARSAGYTDAYTSNDADNLPMLAVNRWFGYEICASEVRHVRTFG